MSKSRYARLAGVVILGAVGLSIGVARALADAGARVHTVEYLQSRAISIDHASMQAIPCDDAQIYQHASVQTPIDNEDLPKKQADFGRSAPFWCILGPSQGAPPAGNARPPAFG
jgi:hypothetical protein